MSDPSPHEWELNRENIRPLRGGRKADCLTTVAVGVSEQKCEAQKRFEGTLEAAKNSDNPLDMLLDYVTWFEQSFPTVESVIL
ncbi:unnamed protein product [Gongylonema pulchrum]|uniref:DDE_Tnp_1_7 domain-containing protein n=1 Tax=Gongylonema pulchrum TaxID=637853 RepID=A0A183ET51_9BILA|nr:unnamed protein product [Gongylonema pulchrum]